MEIIVAVFGILLATVTFYLLGSLFERFFQTDDEIITAIVSISLGLGIFSYAVNILGLFGQLTSTAVVCLTMAIILLRYKVLLPALTFLKRVSFSPIIDIRRESLPLMLTWCFIIISTFLLALLPEVTNDALCYQLNIPKELVWQKSTLPLFYDFNSYTPILMNHLYAVGLLFDSAALSRLFHWLCGYLLAVLIYRDSFNLSQNKKISFWIALIFLLTPTIINEITSSYVDIGVALFVYISFLFWQKIEISVIGRNSLAVLCGVFIAFAVSTKILMMIAFLPMLILLMKLALRERSVKIFFSIGCFFSLGVIAGCFFWFIRNYALTGNPFFPYLGRLFGTVDFGYVEHFQGMGPAKNLLNFFLLPLNLTFKPDDYDRGYWIGPAFFCLLPFILHSFWYKKGFRAAGIYVFTFLIIWFVLFHNARFLIPVLCLLFPAAAWGLADCEKKFKDKKYVVCFFKGGFIMLTVLLMALHIYHYRLQWNVIIGRWSSNEYLLKAERSASAADWINQNLPEDVKILNAEEIRGYHINRPAIREVWYRRRTDYPNQDSPNAFYNRLKNEGFTHILRNFNADGTTSERFALLDQTIAGHSQIKLIQELESKNIRENRYRYKIYEIT